MTVGVGTYLAGRGSLRRLSVCHEGFIIGIMGVRWAGRWTHPIGKKETMWEFKDGGDLIKWSASYVLLIIGHFLNILSLHAYSKTHVSFPHVQ